MIELSQDDYLWFVDHCLDHMVGIVEELGDDLANRRPELPGANAPYALVVHCLGVMDHWGGDMVAGRDVVRDREAEFVATGPVADLRERMLQARARFVADLAALESQSPPAKRPADHDAERPYGRTQAGVLIHVFHELAQHLGHLELTRDLLRRAPVDSAGP